MAKAKSKKAQTAAKGDEATKPERNVLDRRDTKLPRNISARTQNHGDDPVGALDVRLPFEISEEEACTLAKEKYFTRGLFVSGGRGKPDRPIIPKLTIKLETIECARVSLYLGPNAGGEMKLGVCKLKSPELVFDVGRKITMSTLVQATPAMGPRVGDLLSRMDTGAQVRIEYEHNAEQLEAFDTEEVKGDANLDKLEKDVKAQVDAFNRGTPAGDSPAADTH